MEWAIEKGMTQEGDSLFMAYEKIHTTSVMWCRDFVINMRLFNLKLWIQCGTGEKPRSEARQSGVFLGNPQEPQRWRDWRILVNYLADITGRI